MKKKKLVLINPKGKDKIGFLVDKESRYPPLSLGIIAALTPDNWEIVLKDENFETFKFEDADLVGITSFTSTATRAYEVAKEYKDKDIPVIMGGIHASMLPEEAEKYVDSVVIGEAESVWVDVLKDFETGILKKRYYGRQLSMENSPPARHDLFHKDYLYSSIQTTRGCPMTCEFCTVPAFNGKSFRARPIEAVLDEIEGMPAKSFMFVDDNIVGYNKAARDHAKAIFKGMIDRGIKKDWFCQASINFGDDEELLTLAEQSGCKMVLIGVESEKTDALVAMNKRSNLKAGVDNYQVIFDKIQSFGIAVLGTFIFGLDTDDYKDLENRLEYIYNSNVDASQVSILTPFPGTKTYDDFKANNRITATNYPQDWEKYDGGQVVINHPKMDSEKLDQFRYKILDKLFDYKRLMTKLRTTKKKTGSAKAAVWAFSANTHIRNMISEGQKEEDRVTVHKLFNSLVK